MQQITFPFESHEAMVRVGKRTMNLGKSIKLCRTNVGLSQEELADRAGVSVSYISLIEKNKRDPPLSTIERIAVAIGVPITILTFLAAERGELRGVPEEVREKLESVALRLMNAKKRT